MSQALPLCPIDRVIPLGVSVALDNSRQSSAAGRDWACRSRLAYCSLVQPWSVSLWDSQACREVRRIHQWRRYRKNWSLQIWTRWGWCCPALRCSSAWDCTLQSHRCVSCLNTHVHQVWRWSQVATIHLSSGTHLSPTGRFWKYPIPHIVTGQHTPFRRCDLPWGIVAGSISTSRIQMAGVGRRQPTRSQTCSVAVLPFSRRLWSGLD